MQIITAEPDITITELQSDDRFFLLACDGVWDCLTNQQAVRYKETHFCQCEITRLHLDHVQCDFVTERLDIGMEPVEIVREVCLRCLAANPKLTAGIGGDNMTCMLVMLDHVHTTEVSINSVKKANASAT